MVRIVQDVPGGGGLRRIGRGLAVTIGLVLLLVGLVAATLPLLYLVFLVSSFFESEYDTPTVAAEEMPLFLGFCAAAVIGLILGVRLIRGRRRLGLFLRKFGLQETTRTVTYALATAVGRSVRLVTLDDAMTAPLGVGRGRRPFFSLTTLLAVGGAGLGLVWFFSGGLDDWIRQGAEDAASQVQGGNPVEQIFASMIAAMVGAVAAAFAAIILVMLPAVFAVGVALFGGSSALAARRAERAATRSIERESDIQSTARSIARRSRRILGPQLVVVRVPSAFWQRAVDGLAKVSDVVVIDVSQPTENLLWEVNTMRGALGGRWVLVAALGPAIRLANPGALAPGTPERRLAEVLDGEEVLAYGGTRSEQRQFARALRRTLDQAGAQR